MVNVLTPPDMSEYVPSQDAIGRLVALIGERGLVNGKYIPWDRLFRLAPPEGIATHQDWWWGVRLARRAGARPIALSMQTGAQFSFNLTDEVIEGLHKVDQSASGNIQISSRVTNTGTRDQYVVNSLIEEAITSSQLEGASTTRKVAKEMLRTGRKPRDRSERMIVNNFNAMQQVREVVGQPLTRQLILDIHRIVTEGTLDDPADAGRFQQPDEQRVAVYADNDKVAYLPPPAGEIEARIAELCAFANAGDEGGSFLHPVIRAVAIHFALGYIHPFADGNGRTARALFYWSMLSQKYWLAEFLTISAILRKAPAKYMRSFIYTETDAGDLTYFILYQLEVIHRSIRELYAYLERKMEEVREAEKLARASGNLNHRQLALIGHAIRSSDAEYTIKSHRLSHDVVYQTARTDLHGLVAQGLLTTRRIGRTDYFYPSPDLAARLTG